MSRELTPAGQSTPARGELSTRGWRRPLLSVILFATAITGFALSRSVADGVTVARVAIESPQGEMVPALWVSPLRPRGTALLAHGITASKETMLSLAESLAGAGNTVPGSFFSPRDERHRPPIDGVRFGTRWRQSVATQLG